MTRPDWALTWPQFLSAAVSLAAQRGPTWMWVNVLCRPWARWLTLGTVVAVLASWEVSSTDIRNALLVSSLAGSLLLVLDLLVTAVWAALRRLRRRSTAHVKGEHR